MTLRPTISWASWDVWKEAARAAGNLLALSTPRDCCQFLPPLSNLLAHWCIQTHSQVHAPRAPAEAWVLFHMVGPIFASSDLLTRQPPWLHPIHNSQFKAFLLGHPSNLMILFLCSHCKREMQFVVWDFMKWNRSKGCFPENLVPLALVCGIAQIQVYLVCDLQDLVWTLALFSENIKESIKNEGEGKEESLSSGCWCTFLW